MLMERLIGTTSGIGPKAIHDGSIGQNSKEARRSWYLWCGLWKAHVLGPFFFEEHVTGDTYFNMLTNQLMPQLDGLAEGLPDYFQHDATVPGGSLRYCCKKGAI